MYGHVVCNKPELKFKEYDIYHSYYCGLCRGMKEETGLLSSFSLSFDMTFLSLLLNSLYEPETTTEKRRCICHMCHSHLESADEYTPYVALMSTLLSYYKCVDDFKDDKNILKFICSLYLNPKASKTEKLYPEKCNKIKGYLFTLSEKENTASLEECANLFGNILGEVFTPLDDMWKDALYSMGFYLGKFVYIADAALDLEDDIKKNRPNPLKDFPCTDIYKECEILLNMMASEVANEFEKLPIIKNAEILRNIIYSGIWTKYNSAFKGA
ncbi:MAG: DUF5685 family protein [Clostridia bacterium]